MINTNSDLKAKNERADLLAVVGDVYCIFSLSHVVSLVKCGTSLYRSMVFTIFLTLFFQHFSFYVKFTSVFTNIRSYRREESKTSFPLQERTCITTN